LPTALSDRSLLDAAVRSPKNGVEMWLRKVEILNINELGDSVSSTFMFLNMHCLQFLNMENSYFRESKRVNCSRKCLLLGVQTHGCAYQQTLHWHRTWKNKSTFITFTLISFKLHTATQSSFSVHL
jgi:hypothetical protein